MENKYRTLVKLIEDNNLDIKKNKCYDSQSGWTGCNYVISDGKTAIYDLSVNGYCFYDDSVDRAIKAVEKYLEEKNMTTFDAFKRWVEKVSV